MQQQSLYLNLKLCRQTFNPSPKTYQFLKDNSYLIPQLLRWSKLEPFPRKFIPSSCEIFCDGVTFMRLNEQEQFFKTPKITEELNNFQPKYSEYFFDGEIALFHCQGEVLIERTQNLKKIDITNLLNHCKGSQGGVFRLLKIL